MGLRYKLLSSGRRQVVNFVLPGSFLDSQTGVMGEMEHSEEATTPMVLRVLTAQSCGTSSRQRQSAPST